MEREFLEGQLAAGRSLEQIGGLVGKHPSTVGYWIKKHGLAAAHRDKNAPKRGVDPAEFAQLVELGLTVKTPARPVGTMPSLDMAAERSVSMKLAEGRVVEAGGVTARRFEGATDSVAVESW